MRATIALLMALILLVPATANADDPIVEVPDNILVLPSSHIRLGLGDGVLDVDGRLYWVPRYSHILTDNTWRTLDDEMLRLQESEIRLIAENQSLRQTADAWQPSWITLALALGTGIAAGMYIQSKL